ncbi:hypothetical protein G9C85_16215 [Halorubellus sp. JP-L1]|uniref:DUF7563 family protein n=1 Tax=Halorubellus sp. JP-L1 TaxID=2715753 RepID=UPI00140CDF75|nr:DUF6510 family protein [Halorubellus sp. JP-L1]NHN43164.1 hypothetical protein [Halorubellus sp. JP-L1]
MDELRPTPTEQYAACANCGRHVSSSYVRVFGDNSGTLHRCSTCATVSDVMDGRGSGVDGR